jgi:hypothetical protein
VLDNLFLIPFEGIETEEFLQFGSDEGGIVHGGCFLQVSPGYGW